MIMCLAHGIWTDQDGICHECGEPVDGYVNRHTTGHTAGPWEAYNGEVTTTQVSGRSYRRIASVQDYGMGSCKNVDEANARLIAAAPLLLDVLQQTLRSLSVLSPATHDGRLGGKIRAAIHKATCEN